MITRRNLNVASIREVLLPGLQAIEPFHFAELFAEPST
jgi:hypothetical protein